MAGTTQFSFKIKLLIDDEVIPLDTEIVSGSSDTQDGVQNGFLFKLDLKPGQVVTIPVGKIIEWIETKMGYSGLQSNPSVKATLEKAFPDDINSEKGFDSDNGTVVNIKNFIVNTSTKESLFSISLDVENSNPNEGFLPLPAAVSKWLKIEKLAISMTTKKTKGNDSLTIQSYSN